MPVRCMHNIPVGNSCADCYDKAYDYVNTVTFTQAISESYTNAREKGFHDIGQSFGDKLMLAVSELAEALEEYRNGCGLDQIYFVLDKDGRPKPEGVPVEIADCLIRLFDNCGYYEIPIIQAYTLKTAYNKTRPHLHGGKKL